MKNKTCHQLAKKSLAMLVMLIMTGNYFYNFGVFAYFLGNHNYIVKEICLQRSKPVNTCQGHCFISKTAETNNPETFFNAPSSVSEVPCQINDEKFNTLSIACNITKMSFLPIKDLLNSKYNSSIFRPPIS